MCFFISTTYIKRKLRKQIIRIENEKIIITADSIDIKGLLWTTLYPQIWVLNGEIPLNIPFAKNHKEEVDDLKWTLGIVNIKETKPIFDNLPEQNQPGPGSRFPGGFCPTLMERFIPILNSLFQKVWPGKVLLNSSYEGGITLISN